MLTDAHIPSHLLSLDAIQLGRLVLDRQSPEQDSHTSEALNISDSQIIKTSQTSFSEVFNRAQGTTLSGALTTLIATRYKKGDHFTARVESASTNIHQLKNPSEVLSDICESHGTKKWIEKAIGRGKKIHMVVGLHILTDAEVSGEGMKTCGHGGYIGAPSAIVGMPAGGGSVQLPTGSADVQVDGGRKELISQDFRFVAPGEQIYAVQYRKIIFKWYSSRKIDKAELEKANWWKVLARHRGADEVAEDDVIEAELEGGEGAEGEHDIRLVSSDEA